MKLNAMSIAIVLACVVGSASAAGQNATAHPAAAAGSMLAQCTPPNASPGPTCDAFHRMLRDQFSLRELGMLFGNQSSYPEAQTGGIERLRRRYEAAVQRYVAAQEAGANAIAGK